MPLPPAARILLVTVACVVALGAVHPAPAHATTRPEARLLHVINNVRANHGLVRLRTGSTIQAAAHRWARYLRVHDSFYHGRISAGTSENIGWVTCRQHWAGALVRMWLNSWSHRVHLLDRGARRIGVGVNGGSWSGYGCVRMAVTRFR